LPIRFYDIDQQQLPQYLTRQFDDFVDSAQRKEWQTQVFYNQKWQTSDAIKFQFTSNFADIQLRLIDCEGNIYISQSANAIRANTAIPGFYIYENTVSLASITPGTYWFMLILGGVTTMISNPQQVNDIWPNTILHEYKNSKFFGNVVYETGVMFGFRCEGFIGGLTPGNERTAYRDQRMNPTTLKSVPFRGWTMEYGKLNKGIPDWVAEILNWIWAHDYVTVDGKLLAVAEGANLEDNEIDKVYPFREWSIEVQDGINDSAKRVNPVFDPNKRIIVIGMMDATLWGDLSQNAGSNLVPVNNVL